MAKQGFVNNPEQVLLGWLDINITRHLYKANETTSCNQLVSIPNL
jgi:hypothetical protein